MKKLRTMAVITAMLLTSASCSLRDFGNNTSKPESGTSHSAPDTTKEKETASTEEQTTEEETSEATTEEETTDEATTESTDDPGKAYTEVELDDIRSHAQLLLDDIEEKNNKTKVSEDIDLLLYDLDACNQAYSYITIEYYLDMDNEENEKLSDDYMETMTIANELISYAFCQGYLSDYKKLFIDYVTEDVIEYYSDDTYDLDAVEEEAREEVKLHDQMLDEYYDIYFDEEMSEKEKALACAEIYLELLKDYDTESFYAQYNRDYTPEEIIELSAVVREEMGSLSGDLVEAFQKCDGAISVLYKPLEIEEPFEVIRKYVSQLSPDLKKSADMINDGSLYYMAEKESAYPGSFTTDLPLNNSALVFINVEETLDLLPTCVHEFGHFHASFYDDITTYKAVTNLDIAEIQSQGLEFLFMQFYDDIYGDQAKAMQLYKTIELVDSVVTGFMIGEFEYTVLDRIDDITPEGVVDLWHEMFDEYNDEVEFYIVNHLFESPGYYISYGVSALAAFDIWEDMQTSNEKALEKYEKIAKVSCSDSQYQFCEATQECGFRDVLNADYVSDLAQKIKDYAASVSD